MVGSRLVIGVVASLLGLTGGSSPKITETYSVVGVYMDEKNQSAFNTHVVGTWAMHVEMPAGSNAAHVQRAAQDQCATAAPNGWRCAEMGQVNLDERNNRARPCSVIALGMYRGKHDDGIVHNYTLWPLRHGFATAEKARKWGMEELERVRAENNNDPLLKVISISVSCTGGSS